MSLQQNIHDLYIVDRHVRGMETRLHSSSRQLDVQQYKLDRITTAKNDKTEQLKTAQTRGSTLEHQAGDIGERIDRLRQQMTQVKNNKEFSALLVEVNTLKIDKSKVEDEALVQMTEAESLKQTLTELDRQYTEQARMVEAAKTELTARQSEVSAELQTLTAKRNEARKLVPPEVLSVFNRLLEQHDGEALAPIEEVDAKRLEYNCGGCYMQIPIEVVNTAITQPGRVSCCPSCGRILFVEDTLKTSMSERASARASRD